MLAFVAEFWAMLVGCSHYRTTFPMTRTNVVGGKHTTVCCLDCGREFFYDWKSMSMGAPLDTGSVVK